jgi:hypothetical protein
MHYKSYYERVSANIKANPRKWLGSIVLVLVERLCEHRALEWTNNRMDEGAVFMIPHIHNILTETIAHPWMSAFFLLAFYSIVIVAIAHISALHSRSNRESPTDIPTGQPAERVRREPDAPLKWPASASAADAKLSDSLELPSSDGIGIQFKCYCDSSTGNSGVVMLCTNDTTQTFTACRARVNIAKSFDSRRSMFVDDLTAHTLLAPFGDVPHNNQSASSWLVRISPDKTHLEIGAGKCPLTWPPREPVIQKQIWLLNISVEAYGIIPREFTIRVEWLRPDTIKVRLP